MAIAIEARPRSPASGVRFCRCCRAVYRQDFQRCPLDGDALEVGAIDPWIGTPVGTHYVIDGLVGEGAMGRVYRAHRKDLPDRHYAIKIMIGDYAATARMRARFQLEAKHASKLAHPNVVGVIDCGETARGVSYLVMDLVEGPSLGHIVQHGPMDPERVIRLARQMCAGLDHAHGRGMIHRDFKPDNILVVGKGDLEVARIADFGLSLSTETEMRLTTTGVVCTPAYAAPEQLRGQPIDQRVDLYALGTTMYEMLSGGLLPFDGDLDASVRAKLMNDAPSVLLVAPNVPPALGAIVGRLLASEPAHRPGTAQAVLRALEDALAAPRSIIRGEQAAPIGRPGAPARKRGEARDESAGNPSAARVRARRWSLGRRVVWRFACGITLGGVLAFGGLRAVEHAGPTFESIAGCAEPALDAFGQSVPPTARMLAAPLLPMVPDDGPMAVRETR